MRYATTLIFSLIMLVPALATASDAPVDDGIPKVQLVQELAVSGMRKLLGWNGGHAYYAKRDGSVSVVDKDGKESLVLQAKEGKGNVLKQPEAIAVADGVIYVADSDKSRVSMFTVQGAYKGSFGGKGDGGFFASSGSNALNSPRGIAVHDGIVYVSDTGNSRVQLFGDNGVFLATLEIADAPENMVAEGKGLAYKLKKPGDIALDASGHIYVLDADDAAIKVYAQNGAYLRQFAEGVKVQAISMAHDGVYVADSEALAILKYDFSGKMVYSFGSKGKGRAQFKSVNGLATDLDRQVLVGDSEKAMLNVFMVESATHSELMLKQALRTSVRLEQAIPLSVGKLVWDGKTALYAIDQSGGKAGSKILRIENGAVAGEIVLKEIEPVALAVDKSGALWVLDKKKERLLKLDETGNILFSIGSSGSQKGEFDEAADIAISRSGAIYVADPGNHRVQVFSNDGVFVKEIKSDASDKLDAPIALVFDAQDGLHVLDKGRGLVASYSARGEALTVFGKQGGSLEKPVALMATRDEVYVVDSDQVRVFSTKGKFIRSFATKGSAPGELSEPIAITATGDTTLAIAERGNKRVQIFATLHKPGLPEKLAAQGGVHAVELTWAASASPHVKQYRIYRSLNADSDFVQVATSAAKPGAGKESYTDQVTEIDKPFFYRVAGETQYGYIGPKSDAVSGVAKKYSPPALESIQAAPTSWQLKMSWKHIDTPYFGAYLVYQKEEGEYKKIGETTVPEFIKDSLAPDTKYTYYVSTRSSDGTESEKCAVTASTLPFNNIPLEIDVIKLRDIFSNSYKLYEQEGVGLIRLTNNTDKPIEKIKITFTLNNVMDFPTEGQIDKLTPGQSAEFTLKAVFNNSILTITEDSSIQAMIEASYFQEGKRVAYTKNSTVTVYDKHRMTWDEHDRLASFVTPKDAPIMNFARAIATQYSETKDESQLASVLFDAMGTMGLTYIQNPSDPYQVSLAKTATTEKTKTIDYVQYPRETLERKSGDCVDLVAFYSTMLESIGINTLMIEVPDHLMMMFSTGISADADGYTMKDMYVIHDGMLWIPVETTVVGSPFMKAWELGAANYYKWKASNQAGVLDVHQSWNTFKPATLPGSTYKHADISVAEISKKFPGDFMSMLKVSSQTKTRRYLRAIEKNPADWDAHVNVGIILAQVGDRKEAMKYFDKVLAAEPKNAAALNNRGNIFMMDNKFPDAQKAYLAATQAGSDDAYIWVNLAKSYKAMNDTKKAKDAFKKAQALDSSVKVKYKALALELMSAL